MFNNTRILYGDYMIIYKTLDNPNVLNKTLVDGITVNGNFRSELNNLDITIEIEYTNISNVFNGNYNYVYISELNKYYFITSFDIINKDIISLNLHIDVLMTYKLDILNSYGLVVKGNNTNMYYPNIPKTTKQIIRKIEFNNPFGNSPCYILTTIKDI